MENTSKPAPLRDRLRRWALAAGWFAGLLVVLGIVFTTSFFGALRSESRSAEVTVPDLTGLAYEDASTVVEPLGLRLQRAGEQHDPAVPTGHVLQQDPPPSAEVKRGRKIKLIVSLGGRVLEVPALVGEAARAVSIQLRRDGFVPGQEVVVPRNDVPAGVVVAQVPSAETPAVPNTRIHRLVSAGRPEAAWVMPELRGRRLDAVRPTLEGAGFRLAVRRVTIPGRRPGYIVGQLPLSGYPLRGSTVIELTVATGTALEAR